MIDTPPTSVCDYDDGAVLAVVGRGTITRGCLLAPHPIGSPPSPPHDAKPTRNRTRNRRRDTAVIRHSAVGGARSSSGGRGAQRRREVTNGTTPPPHATARAHARRGGAKATGGGRSSTRACAGGCWDESTRRAWLVKGTELPLPICHWRNPLMWRGEWRRQGTHRARSQLRWTGVCCRSAHMPPVRPPRLSAICLPGCARLVVAGQSGNFTFCSRPRRKKSK